MALPTIRAPNLLTRPVRGMELHAYRSHEAGDLVGRVLTDDPMIATVIPLPGERTRAALARIGTGFVQHGLQYGEVDSVIGWPPRPLDAVAIWLPSDPRGGTVARAARAVLLAGSLGLSPDQSWRFLTAWREVNQVRCQVVQEPHWTLVAVALNPACRATDLLASVLRPMLDRADADQFPCLHTSWRAWEVLTLAPFGFRVVAEQTLRTGALRCWTLRRDPRSG